MSEQLTLTTFVKQLAAELSRQHVKMPLRNLRAWHLLLYRLKRAPGDKKPAFLSDLWFDWDGPTPESPDLSDLLARLHGNASISAGNPSYAELSVPDPVAQQWRQDISLSPEDAEFVRSAAQTAKSVFEHALTTA